MSDFVHNFFILGTVHSFYFVKTSSNYSLTISRDTFYLHKWIDKRSFSIYRAVFFNYFSLSILKYKMTIEMGKRQMCLKYTFDETKIKFVQYATVRR